MANTKPKTAEANEDLVDLFIPPDFANKKNKLYYLAVNGVAMMVPRGKHVKVPRAYAEVYHNAEREYAMATAFSDSKEQ